MRRIPARNQPDRSRESNRQCDSQSGQPSTSEPTYNRSPPKPGPGGRPPLVHTRAMPPRIRASTTSQRWGGSSGPPQFSCPPIRQAVARIGYGIIVTFPDEPVRQHVIPKPYYFALRSNWGANWGGSSEDARPDYLSSSDSWSGERDSNPRLQLWELSDNPPHVSVIVSIDRLRSMKCP